MKQVTFLALSSLFFFVLQVGCFASVNDRDAFLEILRNVNRANSMTSIEIDPAGKLVEIEEFYTEDGYFLHRYKKNNNLGSIAFGNREGRWMELSKIKTVIRLDFLGPLRKYEGVDSTTLAEELYDKLELEDVTVAGMALCRVKLEIDDAGSYQGFGIGRLLYGDERKQRDVFDESQLTIEYYVDFLEQRIIRTKVYSKDGTELLEHDLENTLFSREENMDLQRFNAPEDLETRSASSRDEIHPIVRERTKQVFGERKKQNATQDAP